MSLSPEQNAAWCRKCIDLINGDDMKEPQLRKYPPMEATEIESSEMGISITQEGMSGHQSVFIPAYFVEQFLNELAEVAGLA